MTEHTPGPWHRDANTVCDQDGCAVLRGLTYQTEESRANLDLAAAAPDLLRELGNLVVACDRLEDAGIVDLDDARRAIRKAYGNDVFKRLREKFGHYFDDWNPEEE